MISPNTLTVLDIIFVTVACLSIGIALAIAFTGQSNRRVMIGGVLMGVVIELGVIAFIVIYVNHWERWGLVAGSIVVLVIPYLIRRRRNG